MSGRVLIIGNGISRIAYRDRITSHSGEVWACNYAFREFPEIITRLTGHIEPLIEAQEWKDLNGYQYRIYAGPLARKRPDWELFTVSPRWHRDSGTTMVAQALHEGLDVDLVGFDLGGPDVYAPDQYLVDKTNWIHRWVEIIEEWGTDRLHFIGHDHLPFLQEVIQDKMRARDYARKYKQRRPHLSGEDYLQTFSEVFMKEKEKEERKIKIRYPNGYICETKASIALGLIRRGDVEEVKTEQAEVKIEEVKKPAEIKATEKKAAKA